MRLVACGVIAALSVSTLLAPPATGAQQAEKVHRIAIVSASEPVADMTEARDPFLRALFSELRRLGYTEGQNLVVERWSGAGRNQNLPRASGHTWARIV